MLFSSVSKFGWLKKHPFSSGRLHQQMGELPGPIFHSKLADGKTILPKADVAMENPP